MTRREVCRHARATSHPHAPGFWKKRFLKKPWNPVGFSGLLGFGLYWVSDFLFEWAVGKLVGWFSSSAKLLFRFASTLDYQKICRFITFWSLEAVNIKKSLIITGITDQNWIKFGAGICWFFQRVLPKKTQWVFWVLPGCLNPVTHHACSHRNCEQKSESRSQRTPACGWVANCWGLGNWAQLLGQTDSKSSFSTCAQCWLLAVITRPPDGVLLAPSALAVRRLASLLEL